MAHDPGPHPFSCGGGGASCLRGAPSLGPPPAHPPPLAAVFMLTGAYPEHVAWFTVAILLVQIAAHYDGFSPVGELSGDSPPHCNATVELEPRGGREGRRDAPQR